MQSIKQVTWKFNKLWRLVEQKVCKIGNRSLFLEHEVVNIIINSDASISLTEMEIGSSKYQLPTNKISLQYYMHLKLNILNSKFNLSLQKP